MFKYFNNRERNLSPNHLLLVDDDSVCPHNLIATRIRRIYRDEKPIRLSDVSQLKRLGQDHVCVECHLANKMICTCLNNGKLPTKLINKNTKITTNDKIPPPPRTPGEYNATTLADKFNDEVIFQVVTSSTLLAKQQLYYSLEEAEEGEEGEEDSIRDDKLKKPSLRRTENLHKLSGIRGSLIERFRQRYRRSRNYLIGLKNSYDCLVWVMKPIKCLHKSVCNIPIECREKYEKYLIESDDDKTTTPTTTRATTLLDEIYTNPIDNNHQTHDDKSLTNIKLLSEIEIGDEYKREMKDKSDEEKKQTLLVTKSTDYLGVKRSDYARQLKYLKNQKQDKQQQQQQQTSLRNHSLFKNDNNCIKNKKIPNIERESGGGTNTNTYNSNQDQPHNYMLKVGQRYPSRMNCKHFSTIDSSESSNSSSLFPYYPKRGRSLFRTLGKRYKLKLKDLFPTTDENNGGLYVEYFENSGNLEDMQYKHSNPLIVETQTQKQQSSSNGNEKTKPTKKSNIQLQVVQTSSSSKALEYNRANKLLMKPSPHSSKSKTMLVKPRRSITTKKGNTELTHPDTGNKSSISRNPSTVSNNNKTKLKTNTSNNRQPNTLKQPETKNRMKYLTSTRKPTPCNSNNSTATKTTVKSKLNTNRLSGISDSTTTTLAKYVEVTNQLKRELNICNNPPPVKNQRMTIKQEQPKTNNSSEKCIRTITKPQNTNTNNNRRTELEAKKTKKNLHSNKEIVLANLKRIVKETSNTNSNKADTDLSNAIQKQFEMNQQQRPKTMMNKVPPERYTNNSRLTKIQPTTTNKTPSSNSTIKTQKVRK